MATQTHDVVTSAFTQRGRPLTVETVLGADRLLLERIEGEEEVSGLFRYSLAMLSKDPDIAAASLLRTPAVVNIELGSGAVRPIHGLVSRFRQLELVEGLTRYEAEIRPWVWFLTLRSDFRTFQHLSVPDIVKQVCKDAGFSDVQLKLVKTYAAREYCVQFRETHFDFIARLMEEEGIWWFLDYQDDKHVLVLADDNSAAKPAPTPKLRVSATQQDAGKDDVITAFVREERAQTAKFAHVDYNFEKPSLGLLSEMSGKGSEAVYEFPAGHAERADGDRVARIRYEELQAQQVEMSAEGGFRGVRCASKIEVTNHYRKNFGGAYFVVRSRLVMAAPAFRTGEAPEVSCQCALTAIPFDVPFRPLRRTPHPRAYGYQSALVVGPAGEEIHVDKYGRVKVQFVWDRLGKKDDKSSCWVRVSSAWAGKQWGFIQIPRIGQEVLVEFLDGDPDRPIVVGRVWNGEQMPPYTLPDQKTQSGVKTRSTMSGTPDTYNEIRFEDRKGSEQLVIHAEKDHLVTVEHDEMETIGANASLDVGGDRTKSIGHDESIRVGNNRTTSVAKDETTSVGGSRSESVGKDEAVSVGGSRSQNIGKADSLVIGADHTLNVGKNATISVADARSTSIGKDDTLNVAKKWVVDSGDEISFTSGDASITMKKNGDIVIKGKNITIEGSGKIGVKASGDVAIKGSKVVAN